jgi:tetratricopeptide (TPR) repeat protein
MTAKILVFVLLIFTFNIFGQTAGKTQNADELLKHLSAAETYQISGDLANAAIENRAILAIALQRMGNIAIEEGKYDEAVKNLSESLNFQDTAPNRLNLAVAHLRQNQPDKAVEEARKALTLEPNFNSANYILGNIYFTKGDYNSALPYLEKVFRTAPDFEVANALGLTYLYLKQLERAKLLFDEVLLAAKKPSPELYLTIAQNYEKTNYPAETEREIKRALSVDPKHPRANFLHGYFILLHAGSERLPEAGTAFEEVLKVKPEDFYSNFFVGVVATSENNHEKAVKYLQKALQLNSTKSEVYLFLAQAQIELNDLVEAEKNLRQASILEKNETGVDAQARRTHFLLGRLLVRTGRKEEGEKELKIAAELQKKNLQNSKDEINQILSKATKEPDKTANPNAVKVNLPPERVAEFNKFKAYLSEILAQAYHNLGVIAVQTGQADEALANFASAAKWKPDFPGLDRNWGIVSFRVGQFEKAIAPLSRHLKTNPNDNLGRRMLGLSYYFTKGYAKATETLKPLETTITADAELAYFYGISLIQTKQNQPAAQIFSKLAEISQTNAEALFYAGQGFMLAGDFARALKELRQVTALNPNLEKANYFIGQSLIRLNRFDEAEKAFSRELEINPADFLSKYHLALTLIERKIEPEKTVSILEEAIALKYDYADARYQLGKIYLEKGETNKAIEQLEIAVNADDKKDYIHYQLSIAYRKASRKEDADRELKRYQELKEANRKNDAPMGNNENSPK